MRGMPARCAGLLLAAVALACSCAPARALLSKNMGKTAGSIILTTRRSRSRPPAALRASRVDLEVYGNPGSRSPLVNWYLEEIGVPYENMDIRTVPGAAAK
jgi:hypothetical protein